MSHYEDFLPTLIFFIINCLSHFMFLKLGQGCKRMEKVALFSRAGRDHQFIKMDSFHTQTVVVVVVVAVTDSKKVQFVADTGMEQ